LAGGRCIVCNKDLTSSHLGARAAIRMIGEVAHIAGESVKGPRGISSVAASDRNDVANLVLLCPNEHAEADSGRLDDPLFTESFLLARKASKEAWIRFVTGLDADRTTTVLRLSGEVRGSTSLISLNDAASVTMTEALRTPMYLPDPRGVGLTVDLAEIANPGSPEYWTTCLRQVDEAIERLRRFAQTDSSSGDSVHVSVFAFALVPILVALGNALDDTLRVDVYDRHRSTDTWNWNNAAPEVPFSYSMPNLGGASEAALVINASGSIQQAELPAAARQMPLIMLEPSDSHIPGPLTFESKYTLAAFTATVRLLFADLEKHKNIRRLHVFMAAPISAAVNFGRVWPVDNAAPSMTIYHRADHVYTAAVELPRGSTEPTSVSTKDR